MVEGTPSLKDVSICGTSFLMHSSIDHMTTGQWHMPRSFTHSCVPALAYYAIAKHTLVPHGAQNVVACFYACTGAWLRAMASMS